MLSHSHLHFIFSLKHWSSSKELFNLHTISPCSLFKWTSVMTGAWSAIMGKISHYVIFEISFLKVKNNQVLKNLMCISVESAGLLLRFKVFSIKLLLVLTYILFYFACLVSGSSPSWSISISPIMIIPFASIIRKDRILFRTPFPGGLYSLMKVSPLIDTSFFKYLWSR